MKKSIKLKLIFWAFIDTFYVFKNMSLYRENPKNYFNINFTYASFIKYCTYLRFIFASPGTGPCCALLQTPVSKALRRVSHYISDFAPENLSNIIGRAIQLVLPLFYSSISIIRWFFIQFCAAELSAYRSVDRLSRISEPKKKKTNATETSY